MNWLGYLDSKLSEIIKYQLDTWQGDLVFPYFPYWVGDYQETEYNYEQQYHEYSFTLTGTTKGTYAQLESDREKIEQVFSNHTYKEKGHGIAIYYDDSIMIPSVDEQIKRMEVHLTVKEWRC